MTLKIRRASPADARAIHDAHMRSILEVCSKDYTAQQLDVWGRRPYNEIHRVHAIKNHSVWVVESETGIKGYAHFRLLRYDGKTEGHLHALYLCPEAVGKGLGKGLLDQILAEAKSSGIERITLYGTLTALPFYEKHGFRKLPGPEYVMFGSVQIPSFPMEIWIANAPPPLRLVRPHMAYKRSYLQAIEEFQSEGRYLSLNLSNLENDFESFVQDLRSQEFRRSETRVPDTIFWAVDDEDHFLGRISFRTELNPFLEKVGGHIGYDVRPSRRKCGYATEMLRQVLLTEGAQKIKKLLLSCDADNIGSKKVSLKNGGILTGFYNGEEIPGLDEEQRRVALGQKKELYWINTVKVPDLETERLVLSRFYQKDAEDVFDYASDPEVAKTVTWEAHKSPEDSLAFIAHGNRNLISREPDRVFLVWGIREKSSGKAIGSISFHQYQDIAGQIDYALGRNHWNKGMTSEAASRVRDWALENIESLERIQSVCLVDNLASRRVMEKMGMKYEGTRRAGMKVKGHLVDLAIYAVTRQDLKKS